MENLDEKNKNHLDKYHQKCNDSSEKKNSKHLEDIGGDIGDIGDNKSIHIDSSVSTPSPLSPIKDNKAAKRIRWTEEPKQDTPSSWVASIVAPRQSISVAEVKARCAKGPWNELRVGELFAEHGWKLDPVRNVYRKAAA